MAATDPRRYDWVECRKTPGRVGFVKRASVRHGWADVNWYSHTKRMPLASLRVLHTIPCFGCLVTDMTRKAELEGGDGKS